MRFDQVIDWGNLVAGLAGARTFFLHFCIGFPEPRAWHRRWMTIAIYAPGCGTDSNRIGLWQRRLAASGYSSVAVRDVLDRCWLALLTVTYIASGVVLQSGYRKSEDTVFGSSSSGCATAFCSDSLRSAFFMRCRT